MSSELPTQSVREANELLHSVLECIDNNDASIKSETDEYILSNGMGEVREEIMETQNNIDSHYDAVHIKEEINVDEHSTIINELRALKQEMIRRDEEKNAIINNMIETNKKLMETLTEEVIALRNEVRQLKMKSLLFDSETETLSSKLPFSSATDLEEFDEELKTDSDLNAELKRILMKVGGEEFKTFVRQAFKKIVIDEVTKQYSWRGTKEKQAIQKFYFVSIIRDVTHCKFHNVDDSRISTVLQQYIVHAKERAEKRQKN
ncbi:uncharacterized protein LOC142238746 [Haematobia irritans]|uniref:uncharacterized protein LOC142238746 n=1 Tax=Haematobia irritans TaxID=7368 RepID=UPI003F507DCB